MSCSIIYTVYILLFKKIYSLSVNNGARLRYRHQHNTTHLCALPAARAPPASCLADKLGSWAREQQLVAAAGQSRRAPASGTRPLGVDQPNSQQWTRRGWRPFLRGWTRPPLHLVGPWARGLARSAAVWRSIRGSVDCVPCCMGNKVGPNSQYPNLIVAKDARGVVTRPLFNSAPEVV